MELVHKYRVVLKLGTEGSTSYGYIYTDSLYWAEIRAKSFRDLGWEVVRIQGLTGEGEYQDI